jgi:2-dehydro-3-deoxygluconokinase
MKRVVTFGELLLSLSAAGQSRLVQAEAFTARYTGAEANVAVSLAQFGLEAFTVSKVPGHEIGQASLNALRRFGVNTAHIARGGDRLGLLYLEQGTSQRPAKVIYDRAASSFRQLRPADLDWDAILAGKDWLHFSGTAPAAGAAVVEVLNPAVGRRQGRAEHGLARHHGLCGLVWHPLRRAGRCGLRLVCEVLPRGPGGRRGRRSVRHDHRLPRGRADGAQNR